MMAGRGAGKTKAASEYLKAHIEGPACLPGPVPHWVGIIAPTLGDAVTSLYEGPSGIRNTDAGARMVQAPGGTVIRWPNGSQAKLYGAHSPDDVERLRAGGNTCFAILEEFAAWRYMDDCFDQLRFGLRSGPRPHWVAATTPKPRSLLKKLIAGKVRGVVTTHATMYDNPHLEESVKNALEETYAGTQLGAQELYGRLLEEDENALWSRDSIESNRIGPDSLPETIRRTVGVDPSGGAGEQGIVVTAKTVLLPTGVRPQYHGIVLDDRSCRLSPDGWGKRAVQAAVDWDADSIVVEINYGGDMAVATIRTAAEQMGVNIPIKKITATRGKAVRAQPVSALSAQGRWHHAGVFEELEDQMTTWFPEIGWSPDRLDACLVAGTMVTTRRGLVPIEDVTTGDLAWTRAGWRRVSWSGMTRSNADVMRVVTTDGEFTATPDHKVWTAQNGFVRVDAMVWGDRIGICPSQLSRSFSTASSSLASLCRKLGLRGSTSRPTRTAGAYPVWGSSTLRYGSPRTASGRFLADTSSITWTSTPSTMNREISGASPARNMLGSMSTNGILTALSGWSIWRAFAPLLRSGTGPRRAVSGTDSTGRTATQRESPVRRYAVSAGSRTRLVTQGRLSTALERAIDVFRTVLTGTARLWTARSADASSCRVNTGWSRRRAHPHVVRTYALETRQPVYDLTIEGEHEFYANGILVHNCVWGAWHMGLVRAVSAGTGSFGGGGMGRTIG
jgi:phage terminase large subunit-like protein